MTFLKLEWLVPLMATFLIFAIIYLKSTSKVDEFIKQSFFKRPANILWFRRACFLIGVGLLLISLLDLRGPEERIESQVPDQKTIIIIDSSASMLAEDVRPNRFKKSILMARHFIKKAFGHKIAVVLFSDTQKRLVPFTDDLDLLDARVAGLEELRIFDGGSNISQAIKESLGYFLVAGEKVSDIGGNILLFTDSEGHDESFDFNLPENVTLAAVGVGTAKGARIPNRDRYGVFRGYKKYKGKEVISRLNENWLKALSDKVESYNYWVANSYTIPTEEILSFFNNSFDKKIEKGMATIRPVKASLVLLPAIVLLALSFLTYPVKSYTVLTLLLVFTLIPLRAEDLPEKLKDDQIQNLMEKMKNGELDNKGKLKFAEILLKSKEVDAAKVLYEENLKHASPQHLNNYAITLIQAKEPERALKVLSRLQRSAREGQANLSDSEKNQLRQNILLALQSQKQQNQQKQKQKQKKKEEEKEKNKNKQQSGEGGEGKSDNNKKDKSEKNSEKKNDKEEKKEKSKKNQEGKDPKEKKKKSQPKNFKEHQDEVKKKRKMVKIPGLIKQIMSDDRTLQKKYLDTSTRKPKEYQKKDW